MAQMDEETVNPNAKIPDKTILISFLPPDALP